MTVLNWRELPIARFFRSFVFLPFVGFVGAGVLHVPLESADKFLFLVSKIPAAVTIDTTLLAR